MNLHAQFLCKFLILIICAQLNFACTYEKRYDEIETVEQQNVTKTRTVCCKGYVRNKDEHNKVICHPECKNCLHGYCLEPNKCICNDGYTGDNCTEHCPDGKWGRMCSAMCKCINGVKCDHKTGHCEQSLTKDRINATNWIRVNEPSEHDKVLKNFSSVLSKFTESFEHLYETVDKMNLSKPVDEVDSVRVEPTENWSIPENLIVPAELDGSLKAEKSDEVHTTLLVALCLLLIILTIVLTLIIRKSIVMIRRIQKNPTDRLKQKLKIDVTEQNRYSSNPVLMLEKPVKGSADIGSIPVPRSPAIKSQNRQLPAPPINDNIYDFVQDKQIKRESTGYVPMLSPSSQQQKMSPITETPVKSFVHDKQRPTYLNIGDTLPEFNLRSTVITPQQSEEIYEDIEIEPETEYEEVGYGKSK